ncbi:MAG: glutamine-hydrolyzing carbamoyl-phosphate synthase small subunit, partial [Elusimicrobia bacterium]|nr:glutamine-hydrolyzing carbamoyl-phosphate synthase small subunit [Elusimicrobiota bacterium]
IVSNWRSRQSLGDFLKQHGIVAIESVDTRALTKHLRNQGAMRACISTEKRTAKQLIQKAKDSPGLENIDLVKEVTCRKPYQWNKSGKHKVIVIDCGVKYNILNELSKNDCQVTVVPAKTSAKQILEQKPDGLMLSNGPGDPSAVTYVVQTVKELIGKLPIFGICLGHQMLGQALGGKTFKLKFGHHGGNHPVKDLKTNKVHITVQNHGFCVDINSLNKNDIEITHLNLNDQTNEGIKHKKLPIFSVQFHPEASPGPHDASYLFGNFVKLMKENNA